MVFLETKRLVLRNLKYEDLNTLFEYRNDPHCAKYQRWDNTSLDYLKGLIEKNNTARILDKKTMQVAIGLKSSNELIGDMFIAFKDNTITLGYTIATKHQRNGYAYEILKGVMTYIFDNFSNYEIACLVHPNNEPSIKLLEKLNFKNEGYVKSIDSVVFSIN